MVLGFWELSRMPGENGSPSSHTSFEARRKVAVPVHLQCLACGRLHNQAACLHTVSQDQMGEEGPSLCLCLPFYTDSELDSRAPYRLLRTLSCKDGLVFALFTTSTVILHRLSRILITNYLAESSTDLLRFEGCGQVVRRL